MDLEARLRAFAAVARRGSFSRAAADLGISQPAVSKHVADLEASLGTRLLVREARGARLTQAGELLASHVGRAEALLARAAAGLASLTDAEAGTLTVAASGTPGVYLLPKALAPFAAARPGVELDVRLGTSATAADLVRAHVAELAILGGPVRAADLEVEPLVEDEIVIVGPPSLDGATSARDIERHAWISREEGSGTLAATEAAMQRLGLRPARRLELPDWELIKGAVAAGAGVAAISRFAVEHELASGRLGLVQLRGWHVVRPLSLVYSRDVPLTPLADHFVATLRRVFGRHDDRLARARASLEYAERADGRAAMDEVQRALTDAAAELRGETDDERLLLARIQSLRAYWLGKQGDFDAARSTIDQALAQPDVGSAAHADLSARRGWLAGRQGDWASSVRLLEKALAEARAASDAPVERRVLLELASAYSVTGRHDRARALLDEAIRAAREAGDDDDLLRAYNNGAGILDATGDPRDREAGEDMLLEGVEHARRVGDRHHVAWLSLNAAVGLVRRGRLRDAERRVEEALDLFEAIGEGGGITSASNLLAWVRLHLGEVDSLERLIEVGRVDRYRGSDLPPAGHAEIAAFLRWRTDPHAALDDLRAALSRAGERGDVDTIRGWLTVGRMAIRLGAADRVAEAQAAADSLEPQTMEERVIPRWLAALRHADAARASIELRSLGKDLESLGSVLDAADAFADAALTARLAGDRAGANRLTAEHERLLASAGAVPLLDDAEVALGPRRAAGAPRRVAPPSSRPYRART